MMTPPDLSFRTDEMVVYSLFQGLGILATILPRTVNAQRYRAYGADGSLYRPRELPTLHCSATAVA